MAQNQTELNIKVKAEDNASDKLKKVSDSVNKVTQSTRALSAASAVVGVALSGAAVAGFTKMTAAASDLRESLNAVAVAYGSEVGQKIASASKTAATEFGLTAQSYNQQMAVMSFFLRNAGFEGEALAEASRKMMERGRDLASVWNEDVLKALNRIRSGLAREIEPLRHVGIQLDENRLKSIAYSEGIAKVGEELTQNQKTMAIYLTILQQTDPYVGDFKRTQDELANSMRTLKAQVHEAGREIGEFFLPMAKKIVGALRGVVSETSSVSSETRNTVVAVTAATLAMPPLLLGVQLLTLAMVKLGAATIAANVAIMGVAALGAFIVQSEINRLNKNMNKLDQTSSDVASNAKDRSAEAVATINESANYSILEVERTADASAKAVDESTTMAMKSMDSVAQETFHNMAGYSYDFYDLTMAFLHEVMYNLGKVGAEVEGWARKMWTHVEGDYGKYIYDPLFNRDSTIDWDKVTADKLKSIDEDKDAFIERIYTSKEEALAEINKKAKVPGIDAFTVPGGIDPSDSLPPGMPEVSKPRTSGASEKEAAIFGVLANLLNTLIEVNEEIRDNTSNIGQSKADTSSNITNSDANMAGFVSV